MRLLFLDMDGVLVTHRSHFGLLSIGLMQRCDPCALGLVKTLVDEFEMTVVLSSTWRRIHTLDAMNLYFDGQGSSLDIKYATEKGTPFRRARKIGNFCREWDENHPEDPVDPTRSLVLDDEKMDLSEEPLAGRLVNTDIYEGFGIRNYWYALRLMGKYDFPEDL